MRIKRKGYIYTGYFLHWRIFHIILCESWGTLEFGELCPFIFSAILAWMALTRHLGNVPISTQKIKRLRETSQLLHLVSMLLLKNLSCLDAKYLWYQLCFQLCLCNSDNQMFFFFNLILGWLHLSRTSVYHRIMGWFGLKGTLKII